jgi:beta-mannosidase
VLRVWGGGLVETDEFYDACDQAGLLVWQEFSQSSSGMQSAPATDDEFVHYLHREAAAVVPARSHHPSLLLWCGGNELDADGRPLDEARSPALAALRDAVARLDPDRIWLPTSPSGPVFHNRLDLIHAAPEDQHDVHGPWEHQGLRAHYELYDAGSSLAHTEFGVEGMTNAAALDRLLPAEVQWPADRSNPPYRHLGEWWNNAPLVQRSFAGRLPDVAALRRASQLLQATGLGYAVEADRRRFPHCSMVLPWQLNESYPNAWCTSSVDYWGQTKPAYHAVARAFARRRVTARTPTAVWAGAEELLVEAWVWDEDGAPPGTVVSGALRSADGTVLASARWPVPDLVTHPRPAGTLRVPAADVPVDAVLVWELAWTAADGSELDTEAVLASSGGDFAPLLDLRPAEVEVRTEPGAVLVTHRAGPLVVGLQVTPDRAVPTGGDPRPLLPGRTRRFAVAESTGVLVESWNTDPVRVDVPAKERTA